MLAMSQKEKEKNSNSNRVYKDLQLNFNTIPNPPSTSPIQPHHHLLSNNPINPLRNKVARESEAQQTSRNAPEPHQVALVLLARHPDVHAPHAGDDVHGQDDGAEHGEFAEDVGRLLGALVHANVDLCEVVAVGAGEEAVMLC
jgi:hypothetical protein